MLNCYHKYNDKILSLPTIMDKILAPIKGRILQYVEFKGFEKIKFFTSLGASASNFRGNGLKSEVGGDVIAKILAQDSDLSSEWLLLGNGDMLKSSFSKNVMPIKVSGHETIYQRMPKVVTTDNTGNDNIALVPVKAAAGYLNGFGDPEFIERLPTYSLPNIQNGTFRMFQIKGDSMLPTLHDKSYVVGQFVENWTRDMKDDRIYIIVSREDGIIVKRCLNRIKKYGNIYCKSDNRKDYPAPISVNPEDVMEVWEFKMYMAFHVPNPADLYDRVSDMEARLFNLESKTKKTS